VILLDEVEKAHPDVFNILLQVLDDGRLTDGQGRTVDFRNAVIVMTSNLGSHVIQEQSGVEQYEQLELSVSEAALDKIGAAGFDPVYGARPLKREIQQQVENPLAQRLLAGEFLPGDTVHVSVKDDVLMFSKSEVADSTTPVH